EEGVTGGRDRQGVYAEHARRVAGDELGAAGDARSPAGRGARGGVDGGHAGTGGAPGGGELAAGVYVDSVGRDGQGIDGAVGGEGEGPERSVGSRGRGGDVAAGTGHRRQPGAGNAVDREEVPAEEHRAEGRGVGEGPDDVVHLGVPGRDVAGGGHVGGVLA